MPLEIGFRLEDWLESVNQTKEQFFRALLKEIDETFNDLVLNATPKDDVTKKGRAKSWDEHIKMNWSHEIDEGGRGVDFSNPFPYGHVLDLGKYPSVGPRTVAGEGGIFSQMAPTGILQPLIKDEKILEKAVRKIVANMTARMQTIMAGVNG